MIIIIMMIFLHTDKVCDQNELISQMYWILSNNVSPTDTNGKQVPDLSEPFDVANKDDKLTILFFYTGQQTRAPSHFYKSVLPYYNRHNKNQIEYNTETEAKITQWLFAKNGPCVGLIQADPNKQRNRTQTADIMVDIGSNSFKVFICTKNM